jgi:hypothetical protein
MRRRAWLVVLVGAVGASACLPIPNRVQETPEITGQLLRAGRPAANVVVGVIPRSGLRSAPASCAASPVKARTDANGIFTLAGHKRWAMWVSFIGESPEWNVPWWLCVAGPANEGLVMQRDRSNAWDEVRLICDLDGPWRTDSLAGREGRCERLHPDQFSRRRR